MVYGVVGLAIFSFPGLHLSGLTSGRQPIFPVAGAFWVGIDG